MRILSIDGGGIRGIIPATLLAALEEMAGRPIHTLFDGFAGTGTGGIMAMGLVCPQPGEPPRSAAYIRSLYLDRGPRIFPLGGVGLVEPQKNACEAQFGVRPPFANPAGHRDRVESAFGAPNLAQTFAPFGGRGKQGNARYPAAPLEEELRREFGTVRLSQAIKPVAVVSCDFVRKEPLIFQGGGIVSSHLGDPEMAVVARATSAAPTFFPGLRYPAPGGGVIYCVDGGLVADDPAMVGYTMGRAMSGGKTPMVLVSLGSGERHIPEAAHSVAHIATTCGWGSLAATISQTLSVAPGALNRSLLRVMPELTYIRVQPRLRHGAVADMDNATPENIEALRRTGEGFVAANRPVLERILRAVSA
ncbi:patatin-like phospholipase family protein [Pararhodobacter sp. SW119]|uniref:patatin-like phospholipase family protein n=1 Tax=Pararhodobacter sp. SW119 TaxID=2780075 RepID=UPI001AE0898B|nr:patatin-like phospholipase family protein [Pararhodobacter sp. SW119]